MSIPVFDPLKFNFADDNIRLEGVTMSGGQSLSGYEDIIPTDGGGSWQADFDGGDFGGTTEKDRAAGLEWRRLNTQMDGGSAPVVVRFRERLYTPARYGPVGPPAVECSVTAPAALRATTLTIDYRAERPLEGGERFTIVHSDVWGERAYEVHTVNSETSITIRPPLREAIAGGVVLDFEDVRCRMRRASAAGNATRIGLYMSGSISFVEFMRRMDA